MARKATELRLIPTRERLLSLLEEMYKRRVMLLGDLLADCYVTGRTSRISREAPVLILKRTGEEVLPGQAANTAANIAALGGVVHPIGVLGKDQTGRELKAALKSRGVGCSRLIESRECRTLAKTRILAGGHHTTMQQVIRVDDDEALELSAAVQRELMAAIGPEIRSAEVVMVSDYGYGLITGQVWGEVLKHASKRKLPVVLDSRYQLSKLQGATLITPNEEEGLALIGLPADARHDLNATGRAIRKVTGAHGVLLTRGNEGMILFEEQGAGVNLSVFGDNDCRDVTGAGDTVAATAVLALAAGASRLEAACLANIAGSIVVMKVGTATVSREEIADAIESQYDAWRASTQSVR